MTAMQAAIGLIQLQHMPQWHRRRVENARQVLAAAAGCPALRVPETPAEIEHAWYKCCVFVRPAALAPGWDRDRIMAAINASGVPCFAGSCSEIYLEKAFVEAGLGPPGRLPVARELGETSLTFLVHPTLHDAEVRKTCDVLLQVMAEASATP